MTTKPNPPSYMGEAKLKVEGQRVSYDPEAPKPTRQQREEWSKIAAARKANFKSKMDAALAAIEASTDWRPIESAPQDGTWVMLTGAPIDLDAYDQEPPAVIGFWRIETIWIGREEGFWAYCHWDGEWRSGYQATKWKPLS